jgi:hypothetical protein
LLHRSLVIATLFTTYVEVVCLIGACMRLIREFSLCISATSVPTSSCRCLRRGAVWSLLPSQLTRPQSLQTCRLCRYVLVPLSGMTKFVDPLSAPGPSLFSPPSFSALSRTAKSVFKRIAKSKRHASIIGNCGTQQLYKTAPPGNPPSAPHRTATPCRTTGPARRTRSFGSSRSSR